MIKQLDEILSALKDKLTDSDDTTLELLGDITDTFNSMNEKIKTPTEDWEKKYNELDQQWREKYKARFFDGVGNEEENTPKPEEPRELTFEALFREEK